jgi:dihydrofolate synthase/folylpolyglutamate synthase
MDFKEFKLADWLDFLEHRHKNEIQLGLDRVRSVALRMKLLDWTIPVIMVAGTNGKGSTVAALESIYCAASYRVGVYTSPHLMVFNERIKLNQQMIADEELCAAFYAVESCRAPEYLTYFEMTTLAALFYFKRQALDILILEVGLGGRLDACNIIDADLAIITGIAFDHQAYLGDSLDAIGYEKAGILRAGKTCIYADLEPPLSVIEQATRLNVQLLRCGRDYAMVPAEDTWELQCQTPFIKKELHLDWPKVLSLPKPRLHLAAAAAASVAAMYLLPIRPLSWQALSDAMKTVQIMGRQELQPGEVSTLFDVAHNPQAVLLLSKFVQTKIKKNRVFAVFSALSDKDLGGLIQAMLACVDAWYPCLLRSPRAASRAALDAAFQAHGIIPTVFFTTPHEAYLAARQDAVAGDVIVVYGSFLMVSAIKGAKVTA